MSLVTPVEVSLWVTRTATSAGSRASASAIDCGVGHGAGLEVERGDVGAEGLGDVAEAVAELTDGDGEDLVAGREGVDDGGFHGAGAGGGEDVDLVLGAEEESSGAP